MNSKNLIHTRALVTKVDKNGYADIVLDRKKACGGCTTSKKENCKSCLSGSKIQATVLNSQHARKGDIVQVSINRTSLLKGAAVLYLIPVAGIMIGGLFGYSFHQFFPVEETLATIFTGIIGLILGFSAVKRISEKMGVNRSITPVISKILFSKSGDGTLDSGKNEKTFQKTCPGCV